MNQIISGTVLIILASGFTAYFFDRNAVAEGKFSAIAIPGLSQLPVVGKVLFDNPPLTYVALLLVIIVHIALFYTRWGLRTRACGEHPRAADTVGINVNRYRYINTMLGGMLAGLAGGFLVLEAVGQFQEGHDGRARLHRAGRHDLRQLDAVWGGGGSHPLWLHAGHAERAAAGGRDHGPAPVCEHDPVCRDYRRRFGLGGPCAPAGGGGQGVRHRRLSRSKCGNRNAQAETTEERAAKQQKDLPQKDEQAEESERGSMGVEPDGSVPGSWDLYRLQTESAADHRLRDRSAQYLGGHSASVQYAPPRSGSARYHQGIPGRDRQPGCEASSSCRARSWRCWAKTGRASPP